MSEYQQSDADLPVGLKTYEVQQIDADGGVLASLNVQAASGESAAKQLQEVASGTETITVSSNNEVVNEMGVDYWQKRVRGRR
jgi:hypothetical protein